MVSTRELVTAALCCVLLFLVLGCTSDSTPDATTPSPTVPPPSETATVTVTPPEPTPAPTLSPTQTPTPEPVQTPVLAPTEAPSPTPNVIAAEHVQNLTIHFIDVGQGDAILIQTPGNNTMLIDGGEVDAGPRLVAYLAAFGVDSVDVVVATHPHADHIGGLISVLSPESGIAVGAVLDNGDESDSNTYRTFRTLAMGHEYATVLMDTELPLDDLLDVDMIVPYDLAGYSSEPNDNSILVRVAYANVSFLFTGDCEEECEGNVLDAELKSNVLKVGHHGSNTASSDAFLLKVLPEIAVISVGQGNSYGHPHKGIIEKLDYLGTVILRTDQLSDVIMTCDGNDCLITGPAFAST